MYWNCARTSGVFSPSQWQLAQTERSFPSEGRHDIRVTDRDHVFGARHLLDLLKCLGERIGVEVCEQVCLDRAEDPCAGSSVDQPSSDKTRL